MQDASTKARLQTKVKAYVKTLGALRRDFDAICERENRNKLLGVSDGDPEIGEMSMDHRTRLMEAHQSTQRQNDRLRDAMRMMEDTEDVALEITTELGRNREKIMSAHQRVRDVSGLTDVARRVVHSMGKRETQQKLGVYAAFFAVCGVIVFMIFRASQ